MMTGRRVSVERLERRAAGKCSNREASSAPRRPDEPFPSRPRTHARRWGPACHSRRRRPISRRAGPGRCPPGRAGAPSTTRRRRRCRQPRRPGAPPESASWRGRPPEATRPGGGGSPSCRDGSGWGAVRGCSRTTGRRSGPCARAAPRNARVGAAAHRDRIRRLPVAHQADEVVALGDRDVGFAAMNGGRGGLCPDPDLLQLLVRAVITPLEAPHPAARPRGRSDEIGRRHRERVQRQDVCSRHSRTDDDRSSGTRNSSASRFRTQSAR